MLTIAGLLEIAWATSMKASESFTRWKPTVLTIVLMLASFGLLSRAMREIPMGTAYAVWVAIGATGVAIVGMIWQGESTSLGRIACLALIVLGVVGLKVLK